jgi:DNA-binding response OmpR family regulator
MRVVVFEKDEALRELLLLFLENKGHQVSAFRDHGECPFYNDENCTCSAEIPCADAMIVNENPFDSHGVDFLERLARKGCRLANTNKAVVGTYMEPADVEVLTQKGYKYMEKPFRLAELHAWLRTVRPTST